ncbi:hypothetical protein NDU88_004929 [Pleurodeles waltl]|uniref:Uncharacterized protein n=1 Tax=Pleurodeles waltl TaxID=8319 RepID=A0AAV7UGM8_PLEWA|nr:hypothetical protein NDU88_004929 [Pleurodeles waltl]
MEVCSRAVRAAPSPRGRRGLGPRGLLVTLGPSGRVGLAFRQALSAPADECQRDTRVAIPTRGDPATCIPEVGWLVESRVEGFYLDPTRDESYRMGKAKPAKTPAMPMETAGAPA